MEVEHVSNIVVAEMVEADPTIVAVNLVVYESLRISRTIRTTITDEGAAGAS